MKVCGACCLELPRESFSKKQWQMKQHQRRCKGCVEADAQTQPKPPPEESTGTQPRHECWICLDDGPDEMGGMPRRDCSCRGHSGFAHLACLEEYAAQKYDFDLRSAHGITENPWK